MYYIIGLLSPCCFIYNADESIASLKYLGTVTKSVFQIKLHLLPERTNDMPIAVRSNLMYRKILYPAEYTYLSIYITGVHTVYNTYMCGKMYIHILLCICIKENINQTNYLYIQPATFFTLIAL